MSETKTRFLRNTQVWKKIFLIITVMAIPLSVAFYAYASKTQEDLAFRRKELVGVQYLRVLRPMLDHLATRREIATDARYSADPQTDRLQALDQQLENDLTAIHTEDKAHGSPLALSTHLEKITRGWAALKAGKSQGPFGAGIEAHNDLAGEIVTTMKLVGDNSNLTLDPDLDTKYLMNLAVSDLPETADGLGRFRTRVSELAHTKSATPEAKASLLMQLGNYQGAKRGIDRDLNHALDYNRSFAAIVQTSVSRAEEADRALEAFLNANISAKDEVTFTPEQAQAVFKAAVNGRWTVFDVCITELQRILSERIASLESQIYTTIGMIVPGILLVFLTCYLITRSITRPLKDAVAVANTIAKGDLSVKIPQRTEDEIGQLFGAMAEMEGYLQNMAGVADRLAGGDLTVKVTPKSDGDRFGTSFKNMLDNTLSLVQSRDERDQLQRDITTLLDEVAGVGSGDLTAEAPVTSGPTGAIADSFNFMVEELRKIIVNVKGSTRQVKASADTIQNVTSRLAQGSVDQAKQIAETTVAVQQMAVSIQQVSENATLSAAVADQSRSNARQGTKAVENNIRGMMRIREQVQETSKRIKRLGERSQEIGEIIQLIDDIADRTSMLALNASIQAAMAGEAGRGFGVVAEEVERLADRSTKATKQIGALVKSIQSETTDAVIAMEETTREVVEGSSLANEAGQALAEIEGVSNRLADLIQTISSAAQEQAKGSDAVAKTMNSIMGISQDIESGTNNAAASVETLVALADSLQGSVSTFRLPSEAVN